MPGNHVVKDAMGDVVLLHHFGERRPDELAIARRAAGEGRLRGLGPGIQRLTAMGGALPVFTVGNVIHQTHVGIEREHRLAFGPGKEFQSIIKVASLPLGEGGTVLA